MDRSSRWIPGIARHQVRLRICSLAFATGLAWTGSVRPEDPPPPSPAATLIVPHIPAPLVSATQPENLEVRVESPYPVRGLGGEIAVNATSDAVEQAVFAGEQSVGYVTGDPALHVEVTYELLREKPWIRRYLPNLQVGVSVEQSPDVPNDLPGDRGTPWNNGRLSVETDVGPVHVTGWKERSRTPRPLGQDIDTFRSGAEVALPLKDVVPIGRGKRQWLPTVKWSEEETFREVAPGISSGRDAQIRGPIGQGPREETNQVGLEWDRPTWRLEVEQAKTRQSSDVTGVTQPGAQERGRVAITVQPTDALKVGASWKVNQNDTGSADPVSTGDERGVSVGWEMKPGLRLDGKAGREIESAIAGSPTVRNHASAEIRYRVKDPSKKEKRPRFESYLRQSVEEEVTGSVRGTGSRSWSSEAGVTLPLN